MFCCVCCVVLYVERKVLAVVVGSYNIAAEEFLRNRWKQLVCPTFLAANQRQLHYGPSRIQFVFFHWLPASLGYLTLLDGAGIRPP